MTQVQGDQKTCQTIGAWKQAAWTACDTAGLVLGDYATSDACGDTGDGFRFVKFSCCKSTPTPPPPPPTRSCTPEEQGGDTSCKPVGVWKQYAGQACEAKGLQLTAYTPVDACGDDSYRLVKYTCCK